MSRDPCQFCCVYGRGSPGAGGGGAANFKIRIRALRTINSSSLAELIKDQR